jgi:ACS family glucarate transporter-like MFS transporter
MGQQDISRQPLGHDAILPDLPPLRGGVSILRPTRVRYRILLAVCGLAVIVYIHRVGFASAARWLRPDLDLVSDDDWSALMWAFLLSYGGFEVPWGLLGDRFGARNLLVIVTLGSSLLTAAVALALFPPLGLSAFALLWALRFAFGLFQAGVFPSLSRLMADWMPTQERASAQGLIWMSTRVGGFLAPHIIVPLIALTGTWHLPFALIASLGAGWCAACWPWFRNRPEQSPAVNEAERRLITEGRAVPSKHGGLPWGRVLRCRSVWALCAMYACGGFAATFFVTLLPGYLSKQRQLPDDTMKWLSSLPLACGIVACVGGGVISDFIIRFTGNRKWGRRLPGMVGALVAGSALLATVWVHEPWQLAGLLCLTFFCNDLGMGPAWASCADVGRRYAGTIGGGMNMLGNLSAAGGMALAGGLFQREKPEIVFVIFACSFWLGSLCWLAVDVTRPVVETE